MATVRACKGDIIMVLSDGTEVTIGTGASKNKKKLKPHPKITERG
jgi:hypothetical protein